MCTDVGELAFKVSGITYVVCFVLAIGVHKGLREDYVKKLSFRDFFGIAFIFNHLKLHGLMMLGCFVLLPSAVWAVSWVVC